MKGFSVIAIGYIAVSVIGMLHYIISGEVSNFADAFFESASGFSTTGATIFTDIESHSKIILFWRSLTQWIGAFGYIIAAAMFLPALEKITPKISDAAKILCIMYITLTALEMILLIMCGLTPYDAAVHTFSTISTGGFGAYETSAAHFAGSGAMIVFAAFMFIGGTNFPLMYLALSRGISEFAENTEFKLYIGIIFAASASIFAGLIYNSTFEFAYEAAAGSVLQTLSIVTTTGFSAAAFNSWPLFCKMILFMLMFVGGCSYSAAGGLKVIRILTAFKLMTRGFFIRLHPNAFVSIKIFDKTMQGFEVSKVAYYIFFYISIIVAGVVLISLDTTDIMTCISAVVSSVGNIGPMFCESGSPTDYSIFSNPSKLLLALIMLAGSIELLELSTWRK